MRKTLALLSFCFFVSSSAHALSLKCGESYQNKLVCLDGSYPPNIYIFSVEKAKGCFSTSAGEGGYKVLCYRDGVSVQMIDHIRLDQPINLELEIEEVAK